MIRCHSCLELNIHVRSRELLCKKLSLQNLVDEGCLQIADVRLMLCLMMQMLLLHKAQVVNMCVLKFVVVVQKL